MRASRRALEVKREGGAGGLQLATSCGGSCTLLTINCNAPCAPPSLLHPDLRLNPGDD